jgi:hypothetical protein
VPELYACFLQGDFVIKRKRGSFNAVGVDTRVTRVTNKGVDMALEQSIIRSAKSTRGIIVKNHFTGICFGMGIS